jgi:hypothetical protein
MTAGTALKQRPFRTSNIAAWSHADHGHDAIAIQEKKYGKVVDSMAQVGDEQYCK